MGSHHVPVRTCVGCGARAPRSELLRIAACADGSTATVDPTGSRPGRGAWIHPRRSCVDRAAKRRVLPRALRLDPQHADLDGVWGELGAMLPDDSGAGPAPTDQR